MSDHNQWYEDIYPRLTGHGLWLRGQEMNTLAAEEFERRHFRLLIARLSTYEDVAASFTHHLLYEIASGNQDVFPDIAYLPPTSDLALFQEHKIPLLLGTNTKFGPERFSLIAFSLSIIQEIMNIPVFLKASDIPLSRAERMTRPDIPLIILGGASAPYTSLFWETGEFADGVFVGGDRGAIQKIFEICAEGYAKQREKRATLERLANIPGFYVSGGPQNLTGESLPRAECAVLPRAIVPYHEDGIGSGYLELSDGCRALCSFCAENWMHKPYREEKVGDLVEQALAMKAHQGLESIDFFSFNFNMYSGFYQLFQECSQIFQKVYLKSQRFDMLAFDRDLVQYQAASGKGVFSCGLEGISRRLRKYLNKNLDDEALLASVELLFSIQARELKIFLLSTGKENEADLAEFDCLLKEIYERKHRQHSRTRVIISITPLVKFPFTPLEFEDAELPEVHEKCIKKITRIAHVHQCEAREAMDTKEYFMSQVLVRGADRRIKKALLTTLDEKQFMYYRGIPYAVYATFVRELESAGCNIERLLRGGQFNERGRNPWVVIKTTVAAEKLFEIFEKNRGFEEAGAGFDKRLIEKPSFTVEDYSAVIRQKKTDERRFDLCVTINERARGLSRKYFATVLASALMRTDSALTPYFRSYAGSRAENYLSTVKWLFGDDVIFLDWDVKALPRLEEILKEPAARERINKYLEGWGVLHGVSGENNVSFTISFVSPYAFDPTVYCKERGLKHVLKKKEHGSYALMFTPEALKKKIIMAVSYAVLTGAKNWLVEVTPGEKFDIEAFMQEAFALPTKDDWVRMQAIARFSS